MQGTIDHFGHQLLPKGNGGALEYAAAVAAGWIVLAGANSVQRLLHGCGHPAGHAHYLAHGAVDLDDFVRRVARYLMELVDVLRDQHMQLAALLQRREREMPGVG